MPYPKPYNCIGNHCFWVRYNYITGEDLCKCFPDNTILTIKAPTGTQLAAIIPDEVIISDTNLFDSHV